MEYLFGGPGEMWWVAAKAVLLYLVVVLAFRVGPRRALADLSAFDFVAAVAIGSIVGRVPNAHDASFWHGLATLLAVLGCHYALTRLRLVPGVAGALEQPPLLLLAEGRVLPEALRRAAMTEADLFALLRRQGVGDPAEVRYAILETRGQLSVIRRAEAGAPPPLVRALVV